MAIAAPQRGVEWAVGGCVLSSLAGLFFGETGNPALKRRAISASSLAGRILFTRLRLYKPLWQLRDCSYTKNATHGL
jgi:hypothetical protein